MILELFKFPQNFKHNKGYNRKLPYRKLNLHTRAHAHTGQYRQYKLVETLQGLHWNNALNHWATRQGLCQQGSVYVLSNTRDSKSQKRPIWPKRMCWAAKYMSSVKIRCGFFQTLGVIMLLNMSHQISHYSKGPLFAWFYPKSTWASCKNLFSALGLSPSVYACGSTTQALPPGLPMLTDAIPRYFSPIWHDVIKLKKAW